MKFTCPKCGKELELSSEALIECDYKTVCPQCLAQLVIVGSYAYVPREDGSLTLRPSESDNIPTDAPAASASASASAEELPTMPAADASAEPTPPPFNTPPTLPSRQSLDPLYDQVVAFLGSCNAITPFMLCDRFDIDLQRANAIIAQLEANGIVGPYNNGAPRTILIPHRDIFSGVPPQYQQDTPTDTDANTPRTTVISCSGCITWFVIISFLIFMLRGCGVI